MTQKLKSFKDEIEKYLSSDQQVISNDGTIISYKTIGNGIPIIIIPGALSTNENYATLAVELSADFTVNIIERRGRGKSGKQGEDYSISKECEDINALQEKTKSQYIFGHSYGGLIALEFARTKQTFSKIALYEPGVSINKSIPIEWATNYKNNLARGRNIEAFADFVMGIGTAPKMPNWIFKYILKIVIKKKEWDTIIPLLPSNLIEHQEVARLNDTFENYKNINADVLLMSGSKSPKFTFELPKVLESVLPNSKAHIFNGLDHFGPDKTGPKEVAKLIHTFFASKIS